MTKNLNIEQKRELAGLLEERQIRRARDDLLTYVTHTTPSYEIEQFHRAVADALMLVEKGEIHRLMITAPPRHGKTQLVSKRFPLWYLGRNPTRQIIHAGYGGDIATDAGREIRNLTYNDSHRDVFPELILSTDSKAADKWHTTEGGVYIAAGVGGPITGRGFNLGIIDDPVKGHEDADSERMQEKTINWYRSDFYSRVMKDDAIVAIGTRWNENDLFGWLLREQDEGGDQWVHIFFPAISEDGMPLCPSLVPLELLLKKKRVSGSRIWQCLYQGNPLPEEGLYFRADWLRYWVECPPLEHMRIYGASDYAVTKDDGDWTVHLVVGVTSNDDIYLLDMWRGQEESLTWVEAFLDLMEKWKTLIWAEEKGQIIKAMGPLIRKRKKERKVYGWEYGFASVKDKPTRARAIQGRMEMGMVYFPRNAPWTSDLVSEVLKFDSGLNDDMVDCLALIGEMMDYMDTGKVPKETPKPSGMMVGGVYSGDDWIDVESDGNPLQQVSMDDMWKRQRR